MACDRMLRKTLALGLLVPLALFAAPAVSPAQQRMAAISADVGGGYARLLFTLTDDADASVQTAGGVLIVSFTKPQLMTVDRLSAQAKEYIAAARRDPDGRAVRLALSRKVTVNATAAGEKFFVDLLPEDWNGGPPSLPQEVIEDLARRAREAERRERLAHQAEQQKKLAPVRVHVGSQPTFTRYVFDIPEQTSVSTDRAKERLTLTFDAPLPFDLADTEAASPASVNSIASEVEADSALVRFSFIGSVDVRTFRDGKSFVVDVIAADAGATPQDKKAAKAALPVAALESLAPANAAIETMAPAAQKPDIAPPATTATQSTAPAKSATAKSAPANPNPATTNPATPTPAAPHPATSNPVTPNPEQSSPAISSPAQPGPESRSAVAPKEKSAAEPQPPDDKATDAKAAEPKISDAKPGEAKPGEAKAVSAKSAEAKAGDTVAVEITRQGANFRLLFPFTAQTAGAVFQRADTLWIVFDTKSAVDIAALDGEATRTVRGAEFTRQGDAAIVRLRLDRPHLSSVATEGSAWTITLGDTVPDPTRALDIARNLIGPNRASVNISFDEPHKLRRIHDPEVGDDLVVVTGFSPARGFINEQHFVEFHVLPSTQGVVIQPLADDLVVDLSADMVVVGRPGGLTLSNSLQSVLHGSALHPVMFDAQVWGLDRQATFDERQTQLMNAAAAASPGKRQPQRIDLARFYLAREMYPEAKGVLDAVLADDHAGAFEVTASVLRAVAEVMMNRPDDALKDLSNPAIGDQHDAPLWRAVAYARQGKWAQARDNFKRIEAAVATLPIELQRGALRTEMRTSIEVGDLAGAANELNDLETIGVSREIQPSVSVLVGRMAEGLGRNEDALAAYRAAADSWDRPSAAQGRLREDALRYAMGDLKREDAIGELETLTTIWRGDDTEVGALEILARLYAEEGRYRDSFRVMRNAVAAHPDSDMTRRIQDEAAAAFDALFLAGKGDALSAIDALSLFYDFRELTPIGHRGDEMIRRLADRLVSVDLLDQAADLLQYQVDHRLQGAARAEVATHLAVIYLMNHRPDRALAALRSTRSAELAGELRSQRLLLEARALSDIGRYDLALDVVSNLTGRETVRLRADILWAARRWAQSAEQIELYYGERWKDWQPLNEDERADILRAAVGYALGEDTLGVGRFRERYAAKMAQTPDARSFEIVTAALGTNGSEFREIARAAASMDTLEGFLRDMQARYIGGIASVPTATAAPSAPATTSALPPQTSAVSGPQPAGGAPVPPPRAAGRTAQR
jgi:tetratricopeptide (TPR) repeat protein